jgi:glycine cleavage system transcriptional repressor
MLHSVRRFAVSAIGPDRPGIIAALSRALLDHAINVDELHMTILHGQFTTMFVVTADDAVDAVRARADLEAAGRQVGLDAVTLSEVGLDRHEGDAATHVVTVEGIDHPGVLQSVSEALAIHRVNIVALQNRPIGGDLSGTERRAGLVLGIALPTGMSVDALEALLGPTRKEQDVDIDIRRIGRPPD